MIVSKLVRVVHLFEFLEGLIVCLKGLVDESRIVLYLEIGVNDWIQRRCNLEAQVNKPEERCGLQALCPLWPLSSPVVAKRFQWILGLREHRPETQLPAC